MSTTTSPVETGTPTCGSCGAQMVVRPAARQTPEQTWCGTWFDHPVTDNLMFGHNSSVLIMSEELQTQNARLLAGATL